MESRTINGHTYASPSVEELSVRLDNTVATSLIENGIEDLSYDTVDDWN